MPDHAAAERLANQPDLPPLVAHVWGRFLELDRRGRDSGMDLMPISYRGLRDWREMTGQTLETWEREAVFRLDDLYMASVAKRREKT